MSNLIYGTLLLVLGGIIFVCCKKENVSSLKTKDETSVNLRKKMGVRAHFEEKKRSYVCANEKIVCLQDCSVCELSSIYHSENREKDFSFIQVLILNEIRNAKLRQYFINNVLAALQGEANYSIANLNFDSDTPAVWRYTGDGNNNKIRAKFED